MVKSLSYYEQALKHTQNPKTRVEYLLEMGRMYLSLGRTEDAIGTYQDALKLNIQDPRVHLGLGMAYASQSQTDLAVRQFQMVIKYAPGSEYAQQAQEWLDQHK